MSRTMSITTALLRLLVASAARADCPEDVGQSTSGACVPVGNQALTVVAARRQAWTTSDRRHSVVVRRLHYCRFQLAECRFHRSRERTLFRATDSSGVPTIAVLQVSGRQ
jgi:hypothetical protein